MSFLNLYFFRSIDDVKHVVDYEDGEGAINRLVDEEEEDTAYDVVEL